MAIQSRGRSSRGMLRTPAGCMFSVMAVEIVPARTLHVVQLIYDAPDFVASNAAIARMEDFSTVYQMASGSYGRRGFRRMDRPYLYARPYVVELHYGTPFWIAALAPTVLLEKLLDLAEQVLLFPSSVSAQREENLLRRDEARRRREDISETRGVETALERPPLPDLTLSVEDREGVDKVGPPSLAAILDSFVSPSRRVQRELNKSYGPGAVAEADRIARRTARGPMVPHEIAIRPAAPDRYPEPPDSFPPDA
jgi:hypothetical protein